MESTPVEAPPQRPHLVQRNRSALRREARHHFEIRDPGPQGCELIQHERLSGVLVPVFRFILTEPTLQAFVALTEACKARVEHAR